MELDAILALLRALSAVVTGALGAAGVLWDFRDHETNKITPGGVAILSGIGFSCFVGIGSAILEGYKAKSDAGEQAARTELLLRELSRTIQPITRFEASYWFRIPAGEKIVDSYMERVRNGIEARLGELREIPAKREEETGLKVTSFGADGEPQSIDIGPQSDLWPAMRRCLLPVPH